MLCPKPASHRLQPESRSEQPPAQKTTCRERTRKQRWLPRQRDHEIWKYFPLNINSTKRKWKRLFLIHRPYEKKWKIRVGQYDERGQQGNGTNYWGAEIPLSGTSKSSLHKHPLGTQKNTVADPALNGIIDQLTLRTCQSRSDFFMFHHYLFYYHVYQVQPLSHTRSWGRINTWEKFHKRHKNVTRDNSRIEGRNIQGNSKTALSSPAAWKEITKDICNRYSKVRVA